MTISELFNNSTYELLKEIIMKRPRRFSIFDEQKVADFARRYMLRSEEYLPSNVAFFEENGEKEYSVEIAEYKMVLSTLCTDIPLADLMMSNHSSLRN